MTYYLDPLQTPVNPMRRLSVMIPDSALTATFNMGLGQARADSGAEVHADDESVTAGTFVSVNIHLSACDRLSVNR